MRDEAKIIAANERRSNGKKPQDENQDEACSLCDLDTPPYSLDTALADHIEQ